MDMDMAGSNNANVAMTISTSPCRLRRAHSVGPSQRIGLIGPLFFYYNARNDIGEMKLGAHADSR